MARYVSYGFRPLFSHHQILPASRIKQALPCLWAPQLSRLAGLVQSSHGRPRWPQKCYVRRESMERLIRERRKRERVDLQCPVQLFTIPEGPATEATTMNLSCDGVYWVSNVPFSLGERVQCSIHITPPGFRAAKTRLLLHCRVRIVRVEESPAGFGVGCQIEEFALFPAHQTSTTELDASLIGELATTQTECA